jgi:hypothetical protein
MSSGFDNPKPTNINSPIGNTVRSICLKVPRGEAEYTRKKLLAEGLLDIGLRIQRDEEHIYMPVRSEKAAELGYEIVELDLVAGLPSDPAHPFLRRKSDRLAIAGSWSVRLQSGGHHVSHMHHEGWMSSAYYARLPLQDVEADEAHEGWIQFGAPPENYGIELPPRRIVQPQPGRLVLFPSYMWHGTIPFQTGDRLTAAFDYQPL